ncbi:MAG: CBS domain-containing protein [Candidatus Azobacteroides sp.]|nr:CBS domain-containing protein [Candidatus Azobacteroides sp.]
MEYERLRNKLKTVTVSAPWNTTPKEIVHLAGWSRRSWHLIEDIEFLLAEYDLVSYPAFSNTYSNGQIVISKKTEEAENIKVNDTHPLVCHINERGISSCDPIPRLSRLRSANLRSMEDRNHTALVSINREATIEEAITLMIKFNYSQLPIMNGNRKVEGLVSWKSIGKAKCLGKNLMRVYDCREEVEIVSINTPLLEVVEKVLKKEVILVRDTDEVICGIITATDITEQFLTQAEPFFLIEQIEKLLRIILMRSSVSIEEMKSLLDPEKLDKEIRGVSDFTFGQYLLILENENMFLKMNLTACRIRLLEYLRKINEIRNDVMHFNVDETSEEDVRHLRETLHLLSEIMG